MIEQLAARVFRDRDMAHKAHWNASTYSEHVALGDFYDEAIEAIDTLVEAYQGMFGKIDRLPDVDKVIDNDIAGHLRDEVEWMEANRDEIANGVNALMNLVDAVSAVYLKAAYKLDNLV